MALTYWSSPEAVEPVVAEITAAGGKAVDLRPFTAADRELVDETNLSVLPDRRRNPCPTAHAVQWEPPCWTTP